ncbi:MAG: LytTR family DNA-binding domain-containing protein [Clostridiaceae bacterium]
MSIRVLIADDDTGMRLVLKKAIEKADSFMIAGEAEDGDAALRLFDSLRPEVVFLDVEMPLVSGIECAKKIADIDPKTIIIFATAHGEYMPDAFEVYAFDYLVKPFKIDRLNQTLERIISLEAVKPRITVTRPPNPARAPEKLIIRNKEGISLVDMDEIILIQREDRSTVIYTSQERFTTSEGLSELEEKLDSDSFFRCHKSYIINLNAISRIYPYGRWTYIVKLKGTDRDALLTHDKYEELEKLFAGDHQ